ncbi:hypothetical protein [Pseudomonas vancouverensis]|uniref:Uncharacterized protein n=1 Tax=Pseudomonas vancouverensis TaxID=95300 RepID=A0A1H2MUF6_PSEVA|nr:hypothetical protein [Pseudomonas vancouverensis]KAB0489715.1 hypothetical protein F7R09_28785 [Pseudomonas vancouverensis]TDB67211.1 hypothetical protein EIY72_03955 [Pseudomonas vancouverensis]SDU96800.1 hypothetical protein SAMN05216558_1284 [Pseudomonas vancouverensis]
MTDKSLATQSATAALEVVIELIRAGELKLSVADEKASTIIDVHKQLTEHFESIKKAPMNISQGLTR